MDSFSFLSLGLALCLLGCGCVPAVSESSAEFSSSSFFRAASVQRVSCRRWFSYATLPSFASLPRSSYDTIPSGLHQTSLSVLSLRLQLDELQSSGALQPSFSAAVR